MEVEKRKPLDSDQFHYDLPGLVEQLTYIDAGDETGLDNLHKHVRAALVEYGADFSAIAEASQRAEQGDEEARKLIHSMGSKTNKDRALAMVVVWGNERWEAYQVWAKQMVEVYEKDGKKLPKMSSSGSKTSGMIHAMGDLTAWASGVVDDETAKYRLSVRLENGRMWAEGKRRSRKKIIIGRELKMPGSIPPGFIDHMGKWLQETAFK